MSSSILHQDNHRLGIVICAYTVKATQKYFLVQKKEDHVHS